MEVYRRQVERKGKGIFQSSKTRGEGKLGKKGRQKRMPGKASSDE